MNVRSPDGLICPARRLNPAANSARVTWRSRSMSNVIALAITSPAPETDAAQSVCSKPVMKPSLFLSATSKASAAPALDLGQELVVHLGGAALAGLRHGEPVERALPHRSLAEDAHDLIPARDVVREIQQQNAARRGFVAFVGSHATVVDRKLLEIGQEMEDVNKVYEEALQTAENRFNDTRSMFGKWETCKFLHNTVEPSKYGNLPSEVITIKFNGDGGPYKVTVTSVKFNNRWYCMGDLNWVVKTD